MRRSARNHLRGALKHVGLDASAGDAAFEPAILMHYHMAAARPGCGAPGRYNRRQRQPGAAPFHGLADDRAIVVQKPAS